jgi:hypothetical protein
MTQRKGHRPLPEDGISSAHVDCAASKPAHNNHGPVVISIHGPWMQVMRFVKDCLSRRAEFRRKRRH